MRKYERMNAPNLICEIETHLARQGRSVADLCAKIGIHRATWQRWKAGKVSPTFRNLKPLLDQFPELNSVFFGGGGGGNVPPRPGEDAA